MDMAASLPTSDRSTHLWNPMNPARSDTARRQHAFRRARPNRNRWHECSCEQNHRTSRPARSGNWLAVEQATVVLNAPSLRRMVGHSYPHVNRMSRDLRATQPRADADSGRIKAERWRAEKWPPSFCPQCFCLQNSEARQNHRRLVLPEHQAYWFSIIRSALPAYMIRSPAHALNPHAQRKGQR